MPEAPWPPCRAVSPVVRLVCKYRTRAARGCYFLPQSRSWRGDGLAWFRPGAGGANVLHRPRRLLVQMLRGMERPVGIAKELAGQQDEVGLPIADDLVGLRGRGNHPDGAGGDSGFAANSLGVVYLVAGPTGICWAGWLPPLETSMRSTPSCLSSLAKATD